MLKQILKDMYVDPDILAELPEEQQQILFFKIREEQIRRYNEYEKKKPAKKSNNKKKKPQNKVNILEDSISQPWTWVMGDHPNDTPIEEIWANLGNKDWKQSKTRENQPPISKVQALIMAKNKSKTPNKVQNLPPDQTDKKVQNNIIKNNNNNNNNVTKPDLDQQNLSKPKLPSKAPVATPVQPPKVAEKPVQQSLKATQSTPKVDTAPPLTVVKQATTPPPSVSETSFATKSAKPPLPTKPPVGKTPEPKTGDDNTDSDEYENMAELADTLPELKEKEIEAKEWETQLRRFKDADSRRSLNARRASMQIKRLSQQNLAQEQKLKNLKTSFERRRSRRELTHPGMRPALPPKPTNLRTKHPAPCAGRSAKPESRSDVEEWFKETQIAEILASVDDNNVLPSWFHGIITRNKAESLLEGKNTGDFLIRISEKIWGYALSYKDVPKVKHFLIDASETNCYHFFGNDQIRHPGLEQLIAFHQDEPISYGGEMLKNGVGQQNPSNPDYSDLIPADSLSAGLNKVTNDTSF